jgi:ubiquinol oxidase
MNEDFASHENLVRELLDPVLRDEYAKPLDGYKIGIIPAILGFFLVTFGTLVYGSKPSYGKFKAIEVIARIPYQSWEVATYTLLTAFYGNEKHAIRLAKTSAFSRMAQDNETMHVVVITAMAKRHKKIGPFRHMLIPLLFAFFYFWSIYLLYMFSHRASLELNYLFESHAYKQYQEFINREGERLKQQPLSSDFLAFYGREARTEYEFFEMVRNDELIHRNRSIREIENHKRIWEKA